MEILRHKYWGSGERKLQTYPVTNYRRLWEAWSALLQSLQHSNTLYICVHRNQGSICFLYVAMDITAEASATERRDAFETDLSPHAQHIQMDETDQTQWHHWKQYPGWCWQGKLQRKFWRNLFLPHCRWNHDQTWASVTYITHEHIEYSNQLLPTASEHCCSDRSVFHTTISVTILLWPWACPNSAFHTCTAGTDCSGCTKIPWEEAQHCPHTSRAPGPAHGFWERLGSRKLWMVLLTPLPVRGWVMYRERGAKLFKNPTSKYGTSSMSQPCNTFAFCESANQEWIAHMNHG